MPEDPDALLALTSTVVSTCAFKSSVKFRLLGGDCPELPC